MSAWPARMLEAFRRAGLEPPDRAQVDAQGWPSHAYVRALEDHYISKLDPVC